MSSTDSGHERKNIEMSPAKKRIRQTYFSANEKNIVLNVFKEQVRINPKKNLDDIVKITARITGVSERSIYRIKTEYNVSGEVSSPKRSKNRPKIEDKVDDFDKEAIRRVVHQFFHRGELPTINKILETVNADSSSPNFKRSSFHKLLKTLKFKFCRRGRDSCLTEREDIVLWRRNYLRKIREYRAANHPIYYLDETWFERLIIMHIGNENGFMNDALLAFESKKSVNYHEEMDSTHFEEWFSKVVDKIENNAVIVMDNAPYHSRKLNKIPNIHWKKSEIQQWLQSRNITYIEDMLKIELMQIVKQQEVNHIYAVDEIAKIKNITILRLPPYHCELNPIELIWTQIKNYVATRNVHFIFADIENLFHEAVNAVTIDDWKKCINHVVTKVENKFWELDGTIENTLESFIINVNDSDTSDSDMS